MSDGQTKGEKAEARRGLRQLYVAGCLGCLEQRRQDSNRVTAAVLNEKFGMEDEEFCDKVAVYKHTPDCIARTASTTKDSLRSLKSEVNSIRGSLATLRAAVGQQTESNRRVLDNFAGNHFDPDEIEDLNEKVSALGEGVCGIGKNLTSRADVAMNSRVKLWEGQRAFARRLLKIEGERDLEPGKPCALGAFLASMDPDTTRVVFKTGVISLFTSVTAITLAAMVLKWSLS